MAAHSEFPEYAHGGIRGEKRKKGSARLDEWKQEDVKIERREGRKKKKKKKGKGERKKETA